MDRIASDLDSQASHFEEAAKKLREAAAVLRGGVSEYDGNGHLKTRAETLAEFISRKGGSATRQEIIREAGIPAGTVASLLGTKKRFHKDEMNKWHVKSQMVKA